MTMIHPTDTAGPKPLSDDEMVEIRAFHVEPHQPGFCAAGIKMTENKCYVCGANSKDICFPRVPRASQDISRLIATIAAQAKTISELREGEVARTDAISVLFQVLYDEDMFDGSVLGKEWAERLAGTMFDALISKFAGRRIGHE